MTIGITFPNPWERRQIIGAICREKNRTQMTLTERINTDFNI